MSEYLSQYYRRVHKERIYGATGGKKAPFLRAWAQDLNPKSVVDWGCGRSNLLERLRLQSTKLYRYDPYIAEYSTLPDGSVDLIVSVDVLEHVEAWEVAGVLAAMAQKSKNALLVIDVTPAKHTLPDGRNAHVTLWKPSIWRGAIEAAFGYAAPILICGNRAAFRTWQVGFARLPSITSRILIDVLKYNVERHIQRK